MPSSTSKAPSGSEPLTLEQIEELGIPHSDPPEQICGYCGKTLAFEGLVAFGKVIWFPRECGCEGQVAAEHAKAEKERAEEAKRRREELARIGISPRYQNAAISRQEGLRFLSEMKDKPGDGLYIKGICGSGKTSLACAIAQELHDARRSVIVTTAIDMLDAIKETFDGKGSTRAEISRFTTVDLLVIDDLGKESAGDWATKTLFQIVNARYGDMLPTLFTSEYPLSKLGERMSRNGYGDPAEAILSRIRETCTLVSMPDIDYRLADNGFPMKDVPSKHS